MNEENNNEFIGINPEVKEVNTNILKPPTVKDEEVPVNRVEPVSEPVSQPFGLSAPVNNVQVEEPVEETENKFIPAGIPEGESLTSIANEHIIAGVDGPIKAPEPTEEEIEASLEKAYVNKERPKHVKKRKGISGLVIFLVLALAIGGGVAYIYIYNPFGDNPQGEPTKSNNQIDIFKDASDTITGTYKSDNGFIGICNAGKYGYANIKTNTGKTVELYGTIKDGVFEYHSNGIDYVIELDDERVELDTNDSSLIGGFYKTDNKLDIEDCYKTYNDTLSKNIRSGIYISGDRKILINVIDKDNIMFMLHSGEIKLINNVTLTDNEVIDDIKNLNINVSDKVVFNEIGLDILSEDESIKGTYKKLDNMDIKDIIVFYGEFNNIG